MKRYKVGSHVLTPNDRDFQLCLEDAYRRKIRPLCCCNLNKPIELYIAHISQRAAYEIRRMPGDAALHTSECDHYEPPLALSGLAQVQGHAIIEHQDSEIVDLKLDFALTKIGGRAMPTPRDIPADSAKSDGTKLTLRGLLHYLWHCAEFDKWYPTMAGKRKYGTFYKYLLSAASGKKAQAGRLSDLIYIPEPFDSLREEEIKSRRILKMAQLANSNNSGATKLGLIVAELYEVRHAQFGHQAVFKGALDYPFRVNEDLFKRIIKHFDVQLGIWDQNIQSTRLVVIGTFKIDPSGIPLLNECAFMNVTMNWIPFETMFELALIERLTNENRIFWKALRFNLPTGAPMANLVLTDTGERPTALCILPPGATNDDQAELLKGLNTEQLDMSVWVWRSGEEKMPTLPLRSIHRQARDIAAVTF